MTIIKKTILTFFYDEVFLQNHKFRFNVVRLIFLPSWIYYHFIDNKENQVFFLKSNIFGIQVSDFQQFYHLVFKSKTIYHFNHHPQIAGPFLFKKQIHQLNNLQNVKIMKHRYLIQRAFSQSLENSIASRIRLNNKIILQSLRSFGLNASLLSHNQCVAFPQFSLEDLRIHRNYVKSKISKFDTRKQSIALHSRSGNFPKLKEQSRISDEFRNTKFKEIENVSDYFDVDRFNFIRIGYFEQNESTQSSKIIDLRQDISVDKELQLSVFSSIDAYFGSSSGPMGFFASQKKPCLLLSTYPIDIEYPSDPQFFIIIPKIIFSSMNNKPLPLTKQFETDLIRIQNLYDDRLLLKLGLFLDTIPQNLVSQIYFNWQNSVLKNKETEWLKESVKASQELALKVARQNFPILPIEYISYVNKLSFS